MAGLKMKSKRIHEVEYHHLDAFISAEYDVNFEVVADQELSNDSAKTMTIRGEVPTEDDLERLQQINHTKIVPPFSLRMLMENLCFRGRLPAGDYVIKVSW